MGTKSRMKEQHRAQKQKKSTNPDVIGGALSVAFEITKVPAGHADEGKIFTLHVKAAMMNGFVHNHDQANAWLKDNSEPVVKEILKQMTYNIRAHEQGMLEATPQQVAANQAAADHVNAAGGQGLIITEEQARRLDALPEKMHGAADEFGGSDFDPAQD